MRFVWVCLAVLACASPEETCDPSGPASVEISVLEDPDQAFAPTAAHDERFMQVGSQGGFHVWLKARSVDDCGGPTHLDYSVRFPGSEAPIEKMSVDAHMIDDSDGFRSTAQATRFQLCLAPVGADFVDREVILAVQLIQGDRVVSDERAVKLHCPTENADVERTCRRICDQLP